MTGRELYELVVEAHANVGSPTLDAPWNDLPQVLRDGWDIAALEIANRQRLERRGGYDERKFN